MDHYAQELRKLFYKGYPRAGQDSGEAEVHSNLFRQGENETVDHYAQELRKLFYKAYPRASQDGGEAEGFGRAVLAYQFVAGLIPVLSTKE